MQTSMAFTGGPMFRSNVLFSIGLNHALSAGAALSKVAITALHQSVIDNSRGAFGPLSMSTQLREENTAASRYAALLSCDIFSNNI